MTINPPPCFDFLQNTPMSTMKSPGNHIEKEGMCCIDSTEWFCPECQEWRHVDDGCGDLFWWICNECYGDIASRFSGSSNTDY